VRCVGGGCRAGSPARTNQFLWLKWGASAKNEGNEAGSNVWGQVVKQPRARGQNPPHVPGECIQVGKQREEQPWESLKEVQDLATAMPVVL